MKIHPPVNLHPMPIVHQFIELETREGIDIFDITPQVVELLESTSIRNGQVLVFSQHTTIALTINENEERLWEDIRVYLKKLAPPENRYLHNDLHLRDVPPDEPINAHSHLMAIALSTSEVIPVVGGKLGLGRWQSLLLLELDGPRSRRVLVQVSGE